MSLIILKAAYFFLPAYIANMTPVLLKKVNLANKPINKKLFGQNKTWRGLLGGTLAGVIIFLIQKILHQHGFKLLSLIEYRDFSLILGLFLGLGAILGDLVESYYKRKRGIKPGKPWLFWDQLDFVIGAFVLASFVYIPPIEIVIVLFILSPILHIATNYLGYLLKINKNKI